jgi:hypothetical protein
MNDFHNLMLYRRLPKDSSQNILTGKHLWKTLLTAPGEDAEAIPTFIVKTIDAIN